MASAERKPVRNLSSAKNLENKNYGVGLYHIYEVDYSDRKYVGTRQTSSVVPS